MKLRKHIRTQRLEDVRQVGMDRVVDFKFGSGEASNHVILELYASGVVFARLRVCYFMLYISVSTISAVALNRTQKKKPRTRVRVFDSWVQANTFGLSFACKSVSTVDIIAYTLSFIEMYVSFTLGNQPPVFCLDTAPSAPFIFCNSGAFSRHSQNTICHFSGSPRLQNTTCGLMWRPESMIYRTKKSDKRSTSSGRSPCLTVLKHLYNMFQIFVP